MFSRYLYLFCFSGLLFGGLAFGQSQSYQWRLRLGAGLMPYQGDLSYQIPNDWLGYRALPRETLPYGVHLGLERRLNATLALGLSGQYGFITANDRSLDANGDLLPDNPNFGRSLNFRSEIAGGQLLLHFRLANGWLLSKRARIAPYLFSGIGVSGWRVYGDLFTQGDDRYYYWSDGSIRLAPEISSPDQIPTVDQDRDFETRLDELATEASGGYETVALHVPMGLGVDFRLTPQLRLGLQAQANYAFTDYLDDVSGQYRSDFAPDEVLAPYASNPSGQTLPADLQRGDDRPNDWYGLLSITLSYDFGVRLRKFRPVSFYRTDAGAKWRPPLDSVATEVAERQIESPTLSRQDVAPLDSSQLPQESPEMATEAKAAEPVAEAPTDASAQRMMYQTNHYYFFGQTPMAPPQQSMDSSALEQQLAETQATVQAMRDSLAAQQEQTRTEPEDASTTEEPANEPTTPAPAEQPSAEDMAAQAEREAMQARIDELEASLTEAQRRQAAAPAPQDDQAEAERTALAKRIRSLEAQTRQPETSDPARQRELESIRRELDQLNRRLTVGAAVVATNDNQGSNGNERRITELEQEVARLRAERDSVAQAKAQADSSKAVSVAADSTLANKALAVDSLQQPIAPVDTAQTDSVEFAYQPTPTPDTVRVMVPPDTVRVMERDTVVETQTEILMGLNRVNVFFSKGASRLFESDYAVLDRLIEDLKRLPELQVRVKGFADQSGSAQINERLSRERAETVATYLKERGVAAARIEIEYFGEENPRYGDGSLDRRVEVEVVKPEAKGE